MFNPAKLAVGMDCADTRDMGQYYRGTYFGVQPDKEGPIFPATFQGAGGKNGIMLHVYDGKDLAEKVYSTKTLDEIGRFGVPMLGNVPVGPTYDYMKAFPVRESLKGLNYARVAHSVPNGNFVINNYCRTAKGARLGRGLQGRNYNTVEEMNAVYNIYNRTYMTWEEAIQKLENGDSLGIPLNNFCGLYLDQGNPDILFSYKDKKQPVGKVTGIRRGVLTIELKNSDRYVQQVLQDILPPTINLE